MYARHGSAAMARCRRPRLVRAWALLLLSLVVGSSNVALADDAGVTPEAPADTCPSTDAVWSYIAQLVPSAAPQLFSAKGHVDIVDLGDRYRVHVVADQGGLERMYVDRSRDCEQRTRFAAEFIVLALLPPRILLGGPTPTADAGAVPPAPPAPLPDSAPSSEAPPATPPVSTPTPPPAPPPPPQGTGTPARTRTAGRAVRLEALVVGVVSPPLLNAPVVTMWGAELRVGVGSGQIAGVASIGYLPRVEFEDGAFRGSVSRVPAAAGIRARSEIGGLEVSGDFGVTTVVEHYEGLSPHLPSDATFLAPGFEIGATVSPSPRAGISALASIRASWLPLAQDLVTLPAGVIGQTPSFWLGAALGISLGL